MDYRNANINANGMIYGKRITSPGTWTIRYENVYCYLLIGEKKALLFDTAYGNGNLREFVEEITDKPVMVVNSHGHFDHTGGNPWWSEVWAGPGAESVMRKAFNPAMQEEFEKKPYPDYQVHTVKDGHIFDLGGREVEVFEIPAHHESSIALLDRQSRTLYSGDEIESGQVLLFTRMNQQPLKEVVSAHLKNMQKLLKYEKDFDVICPGHNGSPLYKGYIHDFISLSEHILDGTAQIMPDLAGFGFRPQTGNGFFDAVGVLERAQYGHASFIYKKEI